MARFSSMGDVTLTTGVLLWLHKQYGWTFTVLTKPPWASLFDGHPAVRAVIAPDANELRGTRFLSLARTLARGKHPAVPEGSGLLDLHGTLRSRLLRLFWNGPVRKVARLGMRRRFFLLSKGRLFRQALRRFNVPQRYALAVEVNAPAPADLLPVIYLSEAEREKGRETLRNLGISGERPVVALHPYAAHTLKAWPQEYWVEFARLLSAEEMDCFVIGTGTPFMHQSADVTGTTTLRESCALLAASDALVTGDSGPMHLAGAVGTPVAALFGPTTEEWGFFPAGPDDCVLQSEIPCRPCSLHGGSSCPNGLRCMRDITPEQVLAAVRQQIEARTRKGKTPS